MVAVAAAAVAMTPKAATMMIAEQDDCFSKQFLESQQENQKCMGPKVYRSPGNIRPPGKIDDTINSPWIYIYIYLYIYIYIEAPWK